jgi:hypothetical protein
MAENPGKQALNPSSLSLHDAAMLLSKVGGKHVSEDVLRTDIAVGAPCTADGSVNLVKPVVK